MSLTAEELVANTSSIASLPSIYYRVSEVINHPRSSANDIGDVVSEDPGLTARVLKLVNSAFFGFEHEIDTVSQSVAIVGTQQLCDLCLATSVIQAFRDIPEDLVNMESFWRHSLACGLCARIIAHHLGMNNVEKFFVAGMLHDIGSPIIYSSLHEKALEVFEIVKSEQTLMHKAEIKVLGFSHANVGHELIKAWKLPESLQEAVGSHHSPMGALGFPLEAAVIHASDVIVHALELGHSGEKFVPNTSDEAWSRINLPLDNLGPILEEIHHQFDDVVRVMLRNI